MSVVSISATSISLSWSVSSGGRVDSWEVAVRQADNRGTTISSGPLSLTTYTISQLEPTTLYTLTVTATNVAGTTNSTPIIVSTGKSIVLACQSISHHCSLSVPTVSENIDTTSDSPESGVTIGGVVGGVLVIAAVTLVLLLMIALLLRRQRGNYSTTKNR